MNLSGRVICSSTVLTRTVSRSRWLQIVTKPCGERTQRPLDGEPTNRRELRQREPFFARLRDLASPNIRRPDGRGFGSARALPRFAIA